MRVPPNYTWPSLQPSTPKFGMSIRHPSSLEEDAWLYEGFYPKPEKTEGIKKDDKKATPVPLPTVGTFMESSSYYKLIEKI
jgi:hypothetical protein